MGPQNRSFYSYGRKINLDISGALCLDIFAFLLVRHRFLAFPQKTTNFRQFVFRVRDSDFSHWKTYEI